MVGKTYLFTGDDDIAKNEEVRRLKTALLPGASPEFDSDTFYAQAGGADEIIARARTHPAVAKQRVVVVKEIERFKEEDRQKLLEYCERPQAATCLILLTSAEPKKDEFLSALQKKAQAKAFKIPYDGRPASSFDLFDRLLEGRADKALEILGLLLMQKNTPNEVLVFLARQYKNMLDAKRKLAKGAGPEALSNNFKGHPYFLDKFVSQVMSADLERLERSITVLAEADMALKTSRLNPPLVLELLVVQLCAN